MNSGDHLWMIANADTPDNIKNHPLLEGIDIPRTGIPTRAGVLLTKTLLFVAEGTGGIGASPIFRAVDKTTGDIIAEIDLPANQGGIPFTYEHAGKQYVAMFITSGNSAAELVAYALP
jgi:quinoprotein glucose dehydrogenase